MSNRIEKLFFFRKILCKTIYKNYNDTYNFFNWRKRVYCTLNVYVFSDYCLLERFAWYFRWSVNWDFNWLLIWSNLKKIWYNKLFLKPFFNSSYEHTFDEALQVYCPLWFCLISKMLIWLSYDKIFPPYVQVTLVGFGLLSQSQDKRTDWPISIQVSSLILIKTGASKILETSF